MCCQPNVPVRAGSLTPTPPLHFAPQEAGLTATHIAQTALTVLGRKDARVALGNGH